MTKTRTFLAWALQVLAAFILGQTLFFKFTGAAESIALFEALGAEPYGRWGTGLAELVAVILLLRPRWAALGGLLTAGLMVGAVGAHLTQLGIVWHDDGGLLFGMAVTALVSGLGVAFLRRGSLPGPLGRLAGKGAASS